MNGPAMLLGQPAYSEQLMRALGLKGDLPQAVDPTFGARFVVEDFSKSEYLWLRRSNLYELGTSQAAVVGQFGIVSFTTRTGSAQGRQTMAIVEQVIVGNAGAATQQIAYGVSFLGSGIADPTATANPRDDRARQTVSAYSMGAGSNAVNPLAGTSHKIATLPAGGSLIDLGPFILTNNDNGVFRAALVFATSVANQAITVSISWREREVYAEELT